MSERRSTSYLLRAIVINTLLAVSFWQVKQGGKLTSGMIALYVGMAVIGNALMYFGARARRTLGNR
jgi:opacity protein-like surface antigen